MVLALCYIKGMEAQNRKRETKMRINHNNSSASQVHQHFMNDEEWKVIYMNYIDQHDYSQIMLLLKNHGYNHSFDHAVALIRVAA